MINFGFSYFPNPFHLILIHILDFQIMFQFSLNKITAPELFERENNSKTSCKGASVSPFIELVYWLQFPK